MAPFTFRFLHWQIVVGTNKKVRRVAVSKIFGEFAHVESTRSSSADEYVWKDDTAVIGTRFQLGTKPVNRSSVKDWDAIRASAVAGRMCDIPADVYVLCYNQLKRIGVDNAQPIGIERRCTVYWGSTGVGKSRLAWHEAGMDAYPKDPLSKFWDGYNGHKHVVIDGKFNYCF